MGKEPIVKYLVRDENGEEELRELKQKYALFKEFYKFDVDVNSGLELSISKELGKAEQYEDSKDYVLIDSDLRIDILSKSEAKNRNYYRNISTNVIRIEDENVFKIGGKGVSNYYGGGSSGMNVG